MRDGISNPSSAPGRNPRIVWTGVILVIIGLSVVLAVGEWFAVFEQHMRENYSETSMPPSQRQTAF